MGTFKSRRILRACGFKGLKGLSACGLKGLRAFGFEGIRACLMKQYLPEYLVVIYSSKSTLYYTQYQASKYPSCTTFSTGNKESNFTKFFFK